MDRYCRLKRKDLRQWFLDRRIPFEIPKIDRLLSTWIWLGWLQNIPVNRTPPTSRKIQNYASCTFQNKKSIMRRNCSSNLIVHVFSETVYKVKIIHKYNRAHVDVVGPNESSIMCK